MVKSKATIKMKQTNARIPFLSIRTSKIRELHTDLEMLKLRYNAVGIKIGNKKNNYNYKKETASKILSN